MGNVIIHILKNTLSCTKMKYVTSFQYAILFPKKEGEKTFANLSSYISWFLLKIIMGTSKNVIL